MARMPIIRSVASDEWLESGKPDQMKRAAGHSFLVLYCDTSTRTSASLPAARLKQILFVNLADVEALHGLAEFAGCFEDNLRILVMSRCLDDRSCALCRVARFEDARADEHCLGAE